MTKKKSGDVMGEYKQMSIFAFTTNADRIRTMVDEELAQLIQCPYEYTGQELKCKTLPASAVTEEYCRQCCLEWLRSTAKESE